MIRYIDMSEATSVPGRFALWDTVIDHFIEDRHGDQDWNWDDFTIMFAGDPDFIDRVSRLRP